MTYLVGILAALFLFMGQALGQGCLPSTQAMLEMIEVFPTAKATLIDGDTLAPLLEKFSRHVGMDLKGDLVVILEGGEVLEGFSFVGLFDGPCAVGRGLVEKDILDKIRE